MLENKTELEGGTEKEQIKETWEFTDRVVSKTRLLQTDVIPLVWA